MRVTACLLAYRRPAFLRPALEELLASLQGTRHQVEVIVHDDSSPEPEARQAAMSLLEEDRISTVVCGNGGNQGVGMALRRCVGVAAPSEWVLKLDTDLRAWRPGWLDEALEDWDPQFACAGGFHYWHDPCDARKRLEGYRLTASGRRWEVHSDVVTSLALFPRELWERHPWPVHSAAYDEDVQWKRYWQEQGYLIGLPEVDYCTNIGFGLTHSTLYDGAVDQVRAIRTTPRYYP